MTTNHPLETNRTEILKEAARAVCWMCAEGNLALVVKDGNYWHMTGYLLTRCHAQGIYRLIEAGPTVEPFEYTDKELGCTGCMGPCGGCGEVNQGEHGIY